MINLLPYKEKKSIEHIRRIRLMETIVVGFICTCVIAAVFLLPTFMTINSRFNIATKQIGLLEKGGKIASDVDLASLNDRVRVASSKLSSPVVIQPTQYIEIIKSVAPSGVTIDRFTMTSNLGVDVFGVVENRESLQSFIRELELNSSVAQVDNPVSNFVKNKNSTFKLSVLFK